MKDPIDAARLVPLEKPRSLCDQERQALELAVGGPGAPEELRPAATAVVTDLSTLEYQRD